MNRYKYGVSVVACARWETRFIVEWLNYYRAIGFDHVYLYCNDDDPRELYGTVLPFVMGADPFVTFRHYPVQGEQLRMYSHFLEHHRDESEWIGFFDIDEFLRLPSGMTIGQFVGQMGEIDCVLFNWAFFGPNGHKDVPGASILNEYTRRQKYLHPFTKYVARSAVFTGPGLHDVTRGHGFWHSPVGHVDQEVRAVNAIGEDMTRYYEGFPERPTQIINEPTRMKALLMTAMVHHYGFRSEAAFAERARRGLGGAFSGQAMWGEIAASDGFEARLASLHEVEDDSLAGFWSDFLQRAHATTIPVAEAAISAAAVPDGLVSRGKRATQSSISTWSAGASPEADAMRALNGVIDGRHKFHTDLEDSPWWRVDLGAVHGIGSVTLYNRIDDPGIAARANRIAIEVGFDPDHLVEVFRREADEPFGGADGRPLVFAPAIPIPGRYVRIRLLERNFLHLDQVEIRGELLPGLTSDADGPGGGDADEPGGRDAAAPPATPVSEQAFNGTRYVIHDFSEEQD